MTEEQGKLWQGSVACPAVDGCRFRIYAEADTEEQLDSAMTAVMLHHVDHDHPGFAVADIHPVRGGVVIPGGLIGQSEDKEGDEPEIRSRLVN